MIRLALALTVCLVPTLASAAPTPQSDAGKDARTGGMGAGTRGTHLIPRPGTDMETAGSGAGTDRTGTGMDSGSGRAANPGRRP